MKEYCTCSSQRIDRAFLSAGIVYCSICNSPVCCDATALDSGVGRHAAEITSNEHFVCWRHWDNVADLAVSHVAVAK